MNHRQIALGQKNLYAVRNLLTIYPGISRTEIAERLGLSLMAVSRHVSVIRAEWGAKPLTTGQARWRKK